jgi:hypothetical protein
MRNQKRTSPILLTLGLALGAVFVIGAGGCRQRRRDARAQAEPVWFGDLRSAPLGSEAEKALARHLTESVLKGDKYAGTMPAGVRNDQLPRVIFLSLSDARSAAHVVCGAGRGAAAAARQALRRAHVYTAEAGYTSRWVKVDFVRGVTAPVEAARGLTLDPALWGMAWGADTGMALLPGELTSHGLIDGEGGLQTERILSYLRRESGPVSRARRVFREGNFAVRRFKTAAYFSEGTELLSLRGGSRTVGPLTPQKLLHAAQAGGRYLVRSTRPNGRFDYLYDPVEDEVPPAYNILRHAGTTYAMFALAAVTGEEPLLAAAREATSYLLEQVQPCEVPGQGGQYVVEDGAVKLGGNALAVLALVENAKITGEKKHLRTAVQLGEWMLSVQEPGGRFAVHKQSHPEGTDSGMRSGYYPGEALFALVRLHEAEGSERWLKAAEDAARYLIAERDAGKSIDRLPPDHWLLYGLNELYRAAPNGLYLQHARRLARAIMDDQNRSPVEPLRRGSYYDGARSTPAATSTEGLCAAYVLERDHGKAGDRLARRILTAARLGVGFQLRTQLHHEAVMYCPNPQRCLGGFGASLTDKRIRIDAVQHNISALLALRRILMRE